MDILQQVKDKLEEMKSKYNQEHDDEDNPNHSDGVGMYWSGVFACLKEISFFVDHLEVKEIDLEKEIDRWQGCEAFPEGVGITPLPKAMKIVERTAKHFFELGLKAQKGEQYDNSKRNETSPT